MINVQKIKKDFLIFEKQKDLVYLDSTATSLKPKLVIDKLTEYYRDYSANIHRGIYPISEKATEEYEKTRKVVADFINAFSEAEVIFTKNTTESLNLLAYSLGRQIIGKGDEIVTTIMEHHSNFIPWQILVEETRAVLKIIDIDENGFLDLGVNLNYLNSIISKKTKILTITAVSNVLGTINPIKEITQLAKKINPRLIVIVDAAQAVPHQKIDVQDWDIDFLAFSGHKMLGPTGVGVLWGKKDHLEKMYPFLFGGGMIEKVELKKTTFAQLPAKFEAGTPPIAEVIGLAEAIRYLEKVGLEKIRDHEKELTNFCLKSLKANFGSKIKLFGPQDENYQGGIIAFNFFDFHPHDVAQVLAQDNVCLRAGHHCAMPLHQRLGCLATNRVSFYIYNDKKDIDQLILSLKKVIKILS